MNRDEIEQNYWAAFEYGTVVVPISEEAIVLVDSDEAIRKVASDHAFYEEDGAQILPGPPELFEVKSNFMFGYPAWRYRSPRLTDGQAL